MRIFYIILSSTKDVFCFWLSLLITGCFCICSCEDDMAHPSASAHISFISKINASWTFVTRSEANVNIPYDTVTVLQGGNVSFYMHTLYTDSIDLAALENCNDTTGMTRATPITVTNMYPSFGVSAYAYTGVWNENLTPNYMYDATASKSGSNYVLASTYYWPGASYKMKFFAYSPKGNAQYTLSGNMYAGSPTISVSIPSNVSEQKDLLVAQSTELDGNTNNAVNLTFNHALTAVKFVCGDDMQGGTVKSVSLKNIYAKGIYNMGTMSWSSQNTLTTFSQVLNKVTTGIPDEKLTTDAQTFMMIPQTLPDNAQIEVVFTDTSNIDHTLTADIKGGQWPMGKTVTYKISSSSINWTYTLLITPPSSEFIYTGGTQQYSVTSYKTNVQGEKQPIAWTAQYSTNNGNEWTDIKPEWLTAFTAAGNGGDMAQSYNITVGAQISTGSNVHTTVLTAAAPKGTETVPYNLSNSAGGAEIQNTANCYVVNAPGFYSFPLVYGNAVKNGISNPSSYTSTASGSNILNPFVNHAGDGITDPYISNNGCAPAKAELVWQDALNLVTNIKYNNGSNGGYISFKVDRDFIKQGNAVIAIKDANNTVLWSWHIWVTDEVINNTIEVTNHDNYKYQLMPVNLGWCDGNTDNYARRSCLIKFKAGNKVQIINVVQAEKTTTTYGGHPYYQWGRKDPFPPSSGLDNTTKVWYAADGSSSTTKPATANLSSGIACIKNYILNPYVMHNQNSADNAYSNLWSANNLVYTVNDNIVVKTIYDPSPVGFKLPASNAFSGFTTTGSYTYTASEINGTWDSSKKGQLFYCGSNKTGMTIFFPASGCHYPNTGVAGFNVFSYCWMAIPGDQTVGHRLSYNVSYVDPVRSYYKVCGFGIRPSRE